MSTREVYSARASLYKPRCPTNFAACHCPPTPAPALPHHDVEFRVRYAETDQMGVVYHTNYLIWCEVGRTDFIRARGMSYADIERAGVRSRGLGADGALSRRRAVRRLIRVRTTLAEVRSRGITFDYVITNVATGARLVTARTALVSIESLWASHRDAGRRCVRCSTT